MGYAVDSPVTREDLEISKFKRMIEVGFKNNIDGLSFFVNAAEDVLNYRDKALSGREGYNRDKAKKQYNILRDAAEKFVVTAVSESVPEREPDLYDTAFKVFDVLELIDISCTRALVRKTLSEEKGNSMPAKIKFAKEKEKKWLNLIERL